MKIIIETPRLLLREFSINDDEKFFELNTDPEVLKYTGDKPFSSLEEAKLFLVNYSDYGVNGYGRWAVINKSDNKFIGWCGLKLNEENMVDLGFRFFRREWNKGYATEAAKTSLNYGFEILNLEKIIGRASIDNKASIRVLEKIGMQFWKKQQVEGLHEAVYYYKSKG